MDKCYAEYGEKCRALNIKDCDGCKFYKTTDKFRNDVLHSVEKLRGKVGENAFRYYHDKYLREFLRGNGARTGRI